MKWLVLVSTFFVVVPLISGIFYYNTLTQAQKTISWYLIGTFIVELTAYLLLANHKSNYEVYGWFIPFEEAMFTYYFTSILTGHYLQYLIILCSLIFIGFSFYYLLKVRGNYFATPLVVIESLLIVAFVLMYFIQLLRAPILINLFIDPTLWICLGIFIFFTGSFISFGLHNYLLEHISLIPFEKAVKEILNIVMYVLFTVGFVCRKANQKLI